MGREHVMGQNTSRPRVERREVRGEPLTLSGWRITPIKRVVHIAWPGGAWLWQRPVAVEIQAGESLRRMPVHNITRRALIVLALSAALVAVVTGRRLRTHGKREQEREPNR